MGDIQLECRDLSKSFGGVCAVDDVDVTFEAGKVTALVGPNGAGKTTLFHLITNVIQPDAGEVRYRGQTLTGVRPWEVARRGIGRLFQDVRVFKQLTVLENILVAFRDVESPLAALFNRPGIIRRGKALDLEAIAWLELVDLLAYRDELAEALSYGQQKLLAIARLLAAGADVLLLDEPSAGINPVLVKRLSEVIKKLASEGKTIVVIEHNMNVVLEIAQWTYFMDDGQVTAFGLPEEVLGDVGVRTRYLGL
jgi:ABC-type branched-subunit amino acid transport system ATPase component